jgi:kumamolisin
VARAPYDQNDLAQYASWAGVGATVHDIPVDGGAQHLVSSVETTLDIELLSSAAPGTTVDVYQAPSDATDKGLIDAYGQVASAGNAQVLALTWDTCELAALQIPGLLMDEHTLFEQISLEGTTIVAATGDSGAYACQNVPSVNIPAADPDALAVGATDVTLWQPVRQTGWWSIYVESAWSNSSCTSLQMPQGEGTGGGTSIAFFTGDRYGDDLSWQATSSPGGNARRLPDVAISGGSGCDAHHMYPIYYRHSWTLRGGTSASAMEWAALILLTDQYLSAKNAAPLGWVNPMVYKIAEKQQPLPAFHDVFIGDNLRQGAGPGWDYSTGWGSPDGWNFAYDVCSALGYCTSGLNSGTPTRVASRTATSTPTRTPTRTPASAPSPIPTLTPARTSSAIVTAAATGTGNALPSATP